MEQRLDKIRLVPDRVGAAEHGEVRLLGERCERIDVEHAPDALDELVRVLRDREQRDAARIVHILIEHTGHAGGLERRGERPRVVTVAEDQQLHEQSIVRSLRNAVPVPTLF